MEIKARVLAADDDDRCRNTTIAFLTSHGYQCDGASSGEEVIQLLKQNRYDLLLSDIEMPGNSDLRLIQDIPQIQAGLPVILMTGYPTVQTAAHSVKHSVVAYLIKPVAPEILLSEIGRAIELSRSYGAVSATRKRLLLTCEELRKMETLLKVPSGDDSKATITAFLDLTIQNMAASLLDLRQLFEALIPEFNQGPQLEWLQSARPLLLVNALRETIAVLAKTKRAFKSKELAELRRKLESLLHEEAAGDLLQYESGKESAEEQPPSAAN